MVSTPVINSCITYPKMSQCTESSCYSDCQSGIFGEFERGTEMGMAAEMLLERHSMLRYSVSRSRYPFNAFIMHWRAPLVSIS